MSPRARSGSTTRRGTGPTSPEYREAPAGEKQAALWGLISATPYQPLPSARVTNSQTVRRLAKRAFLREAFEKDDEVRPPRAKAFHTFGTVAKMRFEADGEHPYTGIFNTGAVGFVRASLAVGMPNYSPAAAFKFLLDGPHPSQNLLVHQSLDKQASRDFFERASTNHTLTPGAFPEHRHAAAPQVLALPDLAPDRAATSGSPGGGGERRVGGRERQRSRAGVPVRNRRGRQRPGVDR